MSDATVTLHELPVDQFYCVYNTVHEMLHDRGYTPQEPFLRKKQYISYYLGLLAELEDDAYEVIDKLALLFSKKKKLLLVYFYPLESKLSQSDINCIHNFKGEKGANELIIVVKTKATPKTVQVLNIMGTNVQLFTEQELMFNVTKHQLVPEHSLVTGEERDKILKLTDTPGKGICMDLLPGLFTTDPVAKYYNFKPDDLVRITWTRPDGNTSISYRIVTYPITDKDKPSK